jgi:hypothetical protein
VAADWFPDLESKSKLRYDAPGTNTSGDAGTAATLGVPKESSKYFADEFSWGYRLVGNLLFNSVFGLVNLSPQVAFAHDVQGNTPSPIGNFVEGRKTVTLSLSGTYLQNWQARVLYSNSFDAGRHNVGNDRDHVTMEVTYAF